MEVSNWLVSWVITYLRDLQPTFIGVIIHLLSTMDIPANLLLVLGSVSDVSGQFFGSNMCDRVDELPVFPYNRG